MALKAIEFDRRSRCINVSAQAMASSAFIGLVTREFQAHPDAARLLFGLGIRHVGVVTARDLLKRFVTLPALRVVAEQDLKELAVGEPTAGEDGGGVRLVDDACGCTTFLSRVRQRAIGKL